MIRLKNRGTCPVCGIMTTISSLKYHVKSCARTTLANLRQCAHCKRPVQSDDLNEHQTRCKLMQGHALDDMVVHVEALRNGLSKLERGELGLCDAQGMFPCSVCGKKFSFGSIVEHEDFCRRRLACTTDASMEAKSDLYREELRALEEEIQQTQDSKSPDAFKLCLTRLQTICANATGEKGQDKKYRKLKRSNTAFQGAIGRWKRAVSFMICAGFQESTHVSKSGEREDVLQLPEPFSEGSYVAISKVLHAANETTQTSTMEGAECRFCHRRFRFDRIAKHETRCASRKAPGKKFDSVSHHLRNTPGACYIAQIKAEGPITKLPRIGHKDPMDDGLTGCDRCGRRFNPESFVKHKKSCKGDRPVSSRPTNPGATATKARPAGAYVSESGAYGRSRPSADAVCLNNEHEDKRAHTAPTRPHKTSSTPNHSAKRATTPGRYNARPTTPGNHNSRPITPGRYSGRSTGQAGARIAGTATTPSRLRESASSLAGRRSDARAITTNSGMNCVRGEGTRRKSLDESNVCLRVSQGEPQFMEPLRPPAPSSAAQSVYPAPEALRGIARQPLKVVEAEKFVDYDQVDTNLDSWLND
eukprot:GEMP01038633.1.p1 GENE.GEMP01038633.1~~GEMP01038633.1.p1  ORF type:complete len:588 (+),score=127.92 GEMP01038633.1:121-1884(+)